MKRLIWRFWLSEKKFLYPHTSCVVFTNANQIGLTLVKLAGRLFWEKR